MPSPSDRTVRPPSLVSVAGTLSVLALGAFAAVVAGTGCGLAGRPGVALCVVGLLGVQAAVVATRLRVSPSRDMPDRQRRGWQDLRPEGIDDDLVSEIDEVARASDRPADDVVREAVRRHREDLVARGFITEMTDAELRAGVSGDVADHAGPGRLATG